jgi:hypothetical protein
VTTESYPVEFGTKASSVQWMNPCRPARIQITPSPRRTPNDQAQEPPRSPGPTSNLVLLQVLSRERPMTFPDLLHYFSGDALSPSLSASSFPQRSWPLSVDIST